MFEEGTKLILLLKFLSKTLFQVLVESGVQVHQVNPVTSMLLGQASTRFRKPELIFSNLKKYIDRFEC